MMIGKEMDKKRPSSLVNVKELVDCWIVRKKFFVSARKKKKKSERKRR